MITIAICDDDIVIHEQLKEIIAVYSIINNQDIETKSFLDTEGLLTSTIRFDVLFLDIRFKNNDIGIDTARIIRNNGYEYIIILLTTLKSKAIEGYEIGAYRYVLKPIIRKDIFALLTNCIDKIGNNSKALVIKHEYDSEIILINTILYIESIARKRCVHTINSSIDTWETLKSIYDQLRKGQFAYIQKGYVANMAKITSFRKNNLILNYEIELAISRQYKESFFSLYTDFMGK